MTSIEDVDLDTYCGQVGNLDGRHGLCPPFELRRIAADWKANGIAISHVVASSSVISPTIAIDITVAAATHCSVGSTNLSARLGASSTSRHRGPKQPDRRCNDFPIATGSIGNQALIAKSTPGAALAFERRPWAIARMPRCTAEPVRRHPRA